MQQHCTHSCRTADDAAEAELEQRQGEAQQNQQQGHQPSSSFLVSCPDCTDGSWWYPCCAEKTLTLTGVVLQAIRLCILPVTFLYVVRAIFHTIFQATAKQDRSTSHPCFRSAIGTPKYCPDPNSSCKGLGIRTFIPYPFCIVQIPHQLCKV